MKLQPSAGRFLILWPSRDELYRHWVNLSNGTPFPRLVNTDVQRNWEYIVYKKSFEDFHEHVYQLITRVETLQAKATLKSLGPMLRYFGFGFPDFSTHVELTSKGRKRLLEVHARHTSVFRPKLRPRNHP